MDREYVRWYSPSLHRNMELIIFGRTGFPVLVFPTSFGRFFEYEERGMVGALSPKLEEGQLQLFCVDTVDLESWYNSGVHPAERLHRQNAYDAYLSLEVVPLMRRRSTYQRVGATGCSFGAYHAVNFALRHPDMITYAVSMSGAFDIPQRFLDGFYNEDAYFHAPMDYLPGIPNGWQLSGMRQNYYVLAVGNTDPLFDQNVKLAHFMGVQQIPHVLDVWEGFVHDWPWWHSMAAKFFL